MELSRRALVGGLFVLAAPAIIRTPGLLMPVRAIPPDLSMWGWMDAHADDIWVRGRYGELADVIQRITPEETPFLRLLQRTS
jgi:hypothetical protein